jgi:hypothetical protein
MIPFPRISSQWQSVGWIALVGVVFLIAYLMARGRRLGLGDLLGFVVMAVAFDFLAFAAHGMWNKNDPGSLIVVFALVFLVPVGAFFTLGVGMIALRLLHIGVTGGRNATDDDRKR